MQVQAQVCWAFAQPVLKKGQTALTPSKLGKQASLVPRGRPGAPWAWRVGPWPLLTRETGPAETQGPPWAPRLVKQHQSQQSLHAGLHLPREPP